MLLLPSLVLNNPFLHLFTSYSPPPPPYRDVFLSCALLHFTRQHGNILRAGRGLKEGSRLLSSVYSLNPVSLTSITNKLAAECGLFAVVYGFRSGLYLCLPQHMYVCWANSRTKYSIILVCVSEVNVISSFPWSLVISLETLLAERLDLK